MAEPENDSQKPSFSDLPKVAIESYRDEFRDLSETWRHLDTKSQGVGAIAGALLVSLFAWIRGIQSPDTFEKLALSACIALLLLAVLAALLALFIRSVAAPPFGAQIGSMVKDILGKSDNAEIEERFAAFHNDQMEVWDTANKEMRAEVSKKAGLLTKAYGFLFAAAIVAAIIGVKAVLS